MIEKAREKTLVDQFEARRGKNKISRERKFGRIREVIPIAIPEDLG